MRVFFQGSVLADIDKALIFRAFVRVRRRIDTFLGKNCQELKDLFAK